MNIGTLTIEMAANVARLQTDMQQAKTMVSDSMKSIEEAVGMAKKAFIAMTGVASADALKNMVLGAIEAAAGLNKLAIQSGITVENLSALAAVGKATGTSADTIAAASNKFSKALASQNEDSKGAAAALKALGLSFNELQTMEPDKRMKLVADAMAQFADGGQKTAAAMMLFGKSGAELLPMLKDLAQAGELQAKVTNEQGLQAQEFQKNMAQLKANGEAWRKSLAMELLPTLNDIVKIMLLLKESTKDVGVAIGDGLKVVLQTVAVLAVNVVYTLKQVYKEAAGIINQFSAMGEAGGVFSAEGRAAWTAAGKKMEADAKAAREDVDRLSNIIMGGGDAGRGRSNPADPRLIGNRPKPVLTGLNGDPTGGSAVKAPALGNVTEELRAYAAGLADLDRIARSTAAKTDNLSKTQEKLRELMASPVYAGYSRQQREQLGFAASLSQAEEDRASALNAATKSALARQEARGKEAEGIREFITAQEAAALATASASENAVKAAQAEFDAFGKTKSQMAEIALLRLQEQQDKFSAGTIGFEAIQRQIDAQKQLIGVLKKGELRDAALDAADQAEKAWRQTANSINASLTDALLRGFESGKDFGQNFADTLENMLKTAILRPLLARVLDPISLAVSGGINQLLGFADGGSPPVGVPSIVGERGPELFIPNTAGTIVPNSALSALQAPQPAQSITVVQNFTVGDVASISVVRQSVQDSERRLVAALSRQSRYGGVLA